MKLSHRLDKLPPYIFVQISRIIARKKAEGAEVVSFGIGDPDMPTPQNIINKLVEAAQIPTNHRYPETDGLPAFRHAIASWYSNQFGLSLDPDKEILPLIGAKEGIGHAAFCFIDQGDIALVPDPGYPVYSVGTMFAGGEIFWMPLLEENGWLPDIDQIPSQIANDAKCIWINYPNNPTGAVASDEFYKKIIQFASKYDIAVLHDAAYSEVSYEGYRPSSFLQLDGAKEVGIEFHSLSKTYNMTGWRLGMAVGNQEMINALFRIKSNLDSGIPQAIQEMAIEALTGSQDSVRQNNNIYQKRRDKVVDALHNLGLEVSIPKASLYLWARIPKGFSSAEFAARLLDDLDIVVSPGTGYGEYGEGYIRLSLTIPDDQIEKALERLDTWQLPKPSGGS